jgi:beta-xylosidase
MCCRGVQSTYNIRVGRSKAITGPFLDKEGKGLVAGGGSLLLGTEGEFIGPGQVGLMADASTQATPQLPAVDANSYDDRTTVLMMGACGCREAVAG